MIDPSRITLSRYTPSLLQKRTEAPGKILQAPIGVLKQPNSFTEKTDIQHLSPLLTKTVSVIEKADVLEDKVKQANIHIVRLEDKKNYLLNKMHSLKDFIDKNIPDGKQKILDRLYRNNLQNREFGKKAPQNFDSERATIADRQGASENRNFEEKPTLPKTDSAGCFGIRKDIPVGWASPCPKPSMSLQAPKSPVFTPLQQLPQDEKKTLPDTGSPLSKYIDAIKIRWIQECEGKHVELQVALENKRNSIQELERLIDQLPSMIASLQAFIQEEGLAEKWKKQLLVTQEV